MTHKEWDDEQCKKYPILYKERNLPMSQTCMCWGFNISPGWYKIIEELNEQLQEIMFVIGCDITVKQVKEKFGTLRFYYDAVFNNVNESIDGNVWGEIIRACVNEAERKTGHTCDVCGKHGTLNNSGWIKCRCEEHKDA
jgi:hypothetical protein